MNYLKQARIAAGLSRDQLAEADGVTNRGQIEKLENGKRQFTLKWAERLAPHLNVNAQELMFGIEDKDQNTSAALTNLLDVEILTIALDQYDEFQLDQDEIYPTERQAKLIAYFYKSELKSRRDKSGDLSKNATHNQINS